MRTARAMIEHDPMPAPAVRPVGRRGPMRWADSRRVRHGSFLAWLLVTVLAGCASAPPKPADALPAAAVEAAADRAARNAQSVVGARYRYGGASVATGFDCSGLVQYAYGHAGLVIPRTVDDQWRASVPIARTQLRRGDLLFFNQEAKNSHVGIYLGRGEFVHAPSSGKRVRIDRIDSYYWRRHLSAARRLRI